MGVDGYGPIQALNNGEINIVELVIVLPFRKEIVSAQFAPWHRAYRCQVGDCDHVEVIRWESKQ